MEGGSKMKESECWNLWSVVNVFTGETVFVCFAFAREGEDKFSRKDGGSRWPPVLNEIHARFRGQSKRGGNSTCLNYTRIRRKYLFRGSPSTLLFVSLRDDVQRSNKYFYDERLISNSHEFFPIQISFVDFPSSVIATRNNSRNKLDPIRNPYEWRYSSRGDPLLNITACAASGAPISAPHYQLSVALNSKPILRLEKHGRLINN